MKTPLIAQKATHLFLLTGIVASLLLAPSIKRADAFGGVVFDPSNFYANIESYYTSIEQLRNAYSQLDAMYTQIHNMEAQLQAMTSRNGWSQLMTQRPAWLPRDYQDTQSMISAGYNPGDSEDLQKWKARKQYYSSKFPALTQTQVAKNATDRNWVVYEHTKANTDEAMVVAETLHEHIGQYREKLPQLRDMADGAEDLKSSVDVTNALLLQSMTIQLDSMEATKQQLQMAAVAQNQDLNRQAINAEFTKK